MNFVGGCDFCGSLFTIAVYVRDLEADPIFVHTVPLPLQRMQVSQNPPH